MKYYECPLIVRQSIVRQIYAAIEMDLNEDTPLGLRAYFSDENTHIRKISYRALGRIYHFRPALQETAIRLLKTLLQDENELLRQSAAYSLGEIGKKHADAIFDLLAVALHDNHHKVRNAVIGALKQMGEKNPKALLQFASAHLHDPDPEVRREIIHGLELRGRTHPADVLPFLKELQWESEKRPRKMIVHVLGQISYKENCLETVLTDLKTWENLELVEEALKEILKVHKSYERFSVKTVEEVIEIIRKEFPE
ncbi:MAG: HEAT repeat domain-containing protein [Candidatus Cloacimonetes bacterium]|nr:HEAT repeat domain-containing protein [Candidatus Cloacimonadota bacterium]